MWPFSPSLFAPSNRPVEAVLGPFKAAGIDRLSTQASSETMLIGWFNSPSPDSA